MRLSKKIPTHNPLRPKRAYDQAMPPFDRLSAKGTFTTDQVGQLHAQRVATNPCQLRRSIETLTAQRFALPASTEGETEDVRQTLAQASDLTDARK